VKQEKKGRKEGDKSDVKVLLHCTDLNVVLHSSNNHTDELR